MVIARADDGDTHALAALRARPKLTAMTVLRMTAPEDAGKRGRSRHRSVASEAHRDKTRV
jgi:hypothetical protein